MVCMMFMCYVLFTYIVFANQVNNRMSRIEPYILRYGRVSAFFYPISRDIYMFANVLLFPLASLTLPPA